MSVQLSERILADNAEVFAAMVDHPFVRAIEDGTLPAEAFDRYLVYEGAFVETAIRIFALAAAKAPGIAAQRRLIAVLDALANGQIAYFEATLAARGIDPAAHDTARPEVAAFRDGMLAIAETGGYPDIVTAMFAAEWMYWTWCHRAASAPIADPDLARWVALHAEEDFAAQARWLRAELDAAGPGLAEADRARLSATFGTVQRLEIAFHAAALA